MTITNAGRVNFSKLIGGVATGTVMAYLAYGTGTAAPAGANTTLGTEVDRAEASVQLISVLAPQDTYRFAVIMDTAAVSVVSEIGLFTAAVAGTMMNRLVLDNYQTTVVGGKILIVMDLTVYDGGESGSGC